MFLNPKNKLHRCRLDKYYSLYYRLYYKGNQLRSDSFQNIKKVISNMGIYVLIY